MIIDTQTHIFERAFVGVNSMIVPGQGQNAVQNGLWQR